MSRFRGRRLVWSALAILVVSGGTFLLTKEFLPKLFKNDLPEDAWMLDPGEWPTTVDEAVAMLLADISEEDKEFVRSTPEEEIIPRFHHGWGTAIRNEFGLWRGNKALLRSCCGENKYPTDPTTVAVRGVWEALQGPVGEENIHPDDASTVIIYAVWASLQ